MSITDGAIAHGPAATGHVDYETKQRQWHMAAILFLVSDIVFVVALFFSYLYLRALNVNHMWMPASVHPPSMSSNVVLSGLVVLSAVFWRIGDIGVRRGNQGQLKAGLTIAWLLFAVDAVVQIRQLSEVTFSPGSGGFASSFYALAGYHMFHLVFGMILGGGILSRAIKGKYSERDFTQVQSVGYFWYWVAIMAIGMLLLPK